jgi:hypothetical protein
MREGSMGCLPAVPGVVCMITLPKQAQSSYDNYGNLTKVTQYS